MNVGDPGTTLNYPDHQWSKEWGGMDRRQTCVSWDWGCTSSGTQIRLDSYEDSTFKMRDFVCLKETLGRISKEGSFLWRQVFFFLTVENVSYCLINYLYLLKVFKIKIELHYVPSSHSSLQYFLCAPVSHYISRLWFPSLLLLEVTLLLPSILDLPTFCLLLENKKASME